MVSQLLDPSSYTLAILMLVASPIVALFGGKLLKPIMGIIGFFIGAYAFLWILPHIPSIHGAAAVILCIVAGLVVGLFFICAVKWGVYILGGIAGFIVGNMVYQLIAQNYNASSNERAIGQPIVIIVFVIVFAIIARCIFKTALKLVTAVVGGYMFAAAIDFFGGKAGWWPTTSFDPSNGFMDDSFGCHGGWCALLFSLWAVMTSIGLIVQFGIMRDHHKEQPDQPTNQHEMQHTNVANNV
jgi:hypothetical protein